MLKYIWIHIGNIIYIYNEYNFYFKSTAEAKQYAFDLDKILQMKYAITTLKNIEDSLMQLLAMPPNTNGR